MKNFIFLIGLMVASVTLYAQKHLPESKSLCGIWRMVGVKTPQGIFKVGGTYKIINADSTYYTLQIRHEGVSSISGYGSFSVTSDSTGFEQVKYNSSPGFSGKKVPFIYKFIDENSLISQYKSGDVWIPEMYERVLMLSVEENEEEKVQPIL